jgi:biotin operon repressor
MTSMASKGSILDSLYTDSGGFDEERAGEVLKKLITIQRGTHAVFFKKDTGLSQEDKVLTYMVVKKLLKSQGAEATGEVSGKEIKEKTGIKSGTVDAAIKKLREDGLITGSGSSYEIPAHEMDAILDRLGGKG